MIKKYVFTSVEPEQRKNQDLDIDENPDDYVFAGRQSLPLDMRKVMQ